MSDKFGEKFFQLRQEKDLTVNGFLGIFNHDSENSVTASYITKIESYNQIPSVGFIKKSAKIFDCSSDEIKELAECAKRDKLEIYKKSLDRKYGPLLKD